MCYDVYLVIFWVFKWLVWFGLVCVLCNRLVSWLIGSVFMFLHTVCSCYREFLRDVVSTM